MAVIITLSLATEAHHGYWQAFVSCGFDDKEPDVIVKNIVAPNYGRVYVKIDHIAFVREYINQTGVECTSIHFVSGEWIIVLGNSDNVRKRLIEAIK